VATWLNNLATWTLLSLTNHASSPSRIGAQKIADRATGGVPKGVRGWTADAGPEDGAERYDERQKKAK